MGKTSAFTDRLPATTITNHNTKPPFLLKCVLVYKVYCIYLITPTVILQLVVSANFTLITNMVGGLEHVLFFHMLGMSSFQLTFTHILQRGKAQPPTRLVIHQQRLMFKPSDLIRACLIN